MAWRAGLEGSMCVTRVIVCGVSQFGFVFYVFLLCVFPCNVIKCSLLITDLWCSKIVYLFGICSSTTLFFH